MRIASALLTASLLTAALPSAAMTAICESPKGRTFGVHGAQGEGAMMDESDGMKGGIVTVSHDGKSRTAKIISRGSDGVPYDVPGILVYQSDEWSTFMVSYEDAVWFYSVYPKPKRMLITQHSAGLGFDKGGAMGKLFVAECTIAP